MPCPYARLIVGTRHCRLLYIIRTVFFEAGVETPAGRLDCRKAVRDLTFPTCGDQFSQVNHPLTVAPLIVVPSQQLHHVAVHN